MQPGTSTSATRSASLGVGSSLPTALLNDMKEPFTARSVGKMLSVPQDIFLEVWFIVLHIPLRYSDRALSAFLNVTPVPDFQSAQPRGLM